MNKEKKYNITKYTLITISCLIYLILGILVLTKVIPTKVENDWSSAAIQFIGIFVSILPLLVELVFKTKFTITSYVLYLVFCILSMGLGSGLKFYDYFEYYDLMLHFGSGVLIAFIIYSAIKSFINPNNSFKMKLFQRFLIALAFCALIGVIWEIWEFTIDHIADLNCQRYADKNGIDFVGHSAVIDTMVDIISNTIGALVTLIPLSIYYYKKKIEPKNLLNIEVTKSSSNLENINDNVDNLEKNKVVEKNNKNKDKNNN